MNVVFKPNVARPNLANWHVNVAVRGTTTTIKHTTVTISEEAKRLNAADAEARPIEKVNTIDELKNYLQGVDLKNTSPDEMAKIAGAMSRTGKFSLAELNPLVGIASDMEPPMDKYAKIDITKHFDRMLDVAVDAAKTDPAFKFSVNVRAKGIQLLNTLADLGAKPAEIA